jgi:exodeoxyribonuclease VII small subunit
MPGKKEVEKLTYEEAYQELQGIVDLLDEGRQPLGDTLILFERGQALARHCENLLNQAQVKMREVTGEATMGNQDA